jgi:hypothetical protein
VERRGGIVGPVCYQRCGRLGDNVGIVSAQAEALLAVVEGFADEPDEPDEPLDEPDEPFDEPEEEEDDDESDEDFESEEEEEEELPESLLLEAAFALLLSPARLSVR